MKIFLYLLRQKAYEEKRIYFEKGNRQAAENQSNENRMDLSQEK